MSRANIALAALGLFSCLASPAMSQSLTTIRVASGLSRPCYVTHAPNDYSRAFIVEQRTGTTGRVRILDLNTGTLLATPFLSVSPVSTGSEQGLLGLAFDPNYSTNGFFYVNYTNNVGDTIIAQYQVSADPNVANPAPVKTVLFVDQPFTNHNGGWIGFGPDGFLYVGMGDGGSAGDPGNRAQNVNDLLGKMLRINPLGDDFPADPNRNYSIPATNPFVGVAGDDAIWATGLRNPWRNSFDAGSGDLYIGDVGQDAWEEIDIQPASSVGGENWGWRCYEGNHTFNPSLCTLPMSAYTFPVHEYSHTGSFFCWSVTGGYVYRGCAIPGLEGTYFFADYCMNRIWSFRWAGGMVTEFTERTTELAPGGGLSIAGVASFGEDAFGEIYLCDLSGGEVFKIVSAAAPTPDCNDNDRRDACDILAGTSEDWNADGIPDECQCLADCEEDGDLDLFDYLCFQGAFATQAAYGDWERDGDWDLFDYLAYQGSFANGCTF